MGVIHNANLIKKESLMNDLQIFENTEFGSIRTIEKNDKVLFCGKDVARALGYARPNDAISAHCKGSVKHRIGVQTGIKSDGTPAIQSMDVIFILPRQEDSDLYRSGMNCRQSVRTENGLTSQKCNDTI